MNALDIFYMLWFLEKLRIWKPNLYQDSFRPKRDGKGFVQIISGRIVQEFDVNDLGIIFT